MSIKTTNKGANAFTFIIIATILISLNLYNKPLTETERFECIMESSQGLNTKEITKMIATTCFTKFK